MPNYDPSLIQPAPGSLPDTDNWNALNDALRGLPDSLGNSIVKAFQVATQVSTTAQSNTLQGLLETHSPKMLLGQDLSRQRVLVTASITDVFISADRSQLISGLGFVIPVGGSCEIKNTGELWVAYRPMASTGLTAYVSYWSETLAEAF